MATMTVVGPGTPSVPSGDVLSMAQIVQMHELSGNLAANDLAEETIGRRGGRHFAPIALTCRSASARDG